MLSTVDYEISMLLAKIDILTKQYMKQWEKTTVFRVALNLRPCCSSCSATLQIPLPTPYYILDIKLQ